METMDGRVAVVTGAASGIGKALAFAFANEVVSEIRFKPMKEKIEQSIESWLKKVL